MALVDFHYVPLAPEPLSGESFISQTEQAFNEIGVVVSDIENKVNEALEIARNAQATANDALQVAQDASSNANNALNVANQALQEAQQAQVTANDAQRIANQALQEARQAQATADDAIARIEAVTNTINDIQADIADVLSRIEQLEANIANLLIYGLLEPTEDGDNPGEFLPIDLNNYTNVTMRSYIRNTQGVSYLNFPGTTEPPAYLDVDYDDENDYTRQNILILSSNTAYERLRYPSSSGVISVQVDMSATDPELESYTAVSVVVEDNVISSASIVDGDGTIATYQDYVQVQASLPSNITTGSILVSGFEIGQIIDGEFVDGESATVSFGTITALGYSPQDDSDPDNPIAAFISYRIDIESVYSWLPWQQVATPAVDNVTIAYNSEGQIQALNYDFISEVSGNSVDINLNSAQTIVVTPTGDLTVNIGTILPNASKITTLIIEPSADCSITWAYLGGITWTSEEIIEFVGGDQNAMVNIWQVRGRVFIQAIAANAYEPTTGTYIIVGNNGTVAYGKDHDNLSIATLNNAISWRSVVVSPVRGQFVISGAGGNIVYGASTDTAQYTQIGTASFNGGAVSNDGNTYYGVAGNTVYSGNDPANYSSNVIGSTTIWYDVEVMPNNTIVICGDEGSYAYGTDVSSMTVIPTGTGVTYNSIAVSPDNRIAIVGSAGSILYGTNLASLTQSTTTTGAQLSDAAFVSVSGSSLFIACGVGYYVYGPSPDSLTEVALDGAWTSLAVRISDGQIVFGSTTGSIAVLSASSPETSTVHNIDGFSTVINDIAAVN